MWRNILAASKMLCRITSCRQNRGNKNNVSGFFSLQLYLF